MCASCALVNVLTRFAVFRANRARLTRNGALVTADQVLAGEPAWTVVLVNQTLVNVLTGDTVAVYVIALKQRLKLSRQVGVTFYLGTGAEEGADHVGARVGAWRHCRALVHIIAPRARVIKLIARRTFEIATTDITCFSQFKTISYLG